ncbi:hypothetical protein [Neobacillus sp. LXY-1]|uniref:hypothetical protein n=1 Tax=Neobacillus sp. LXY-1 TaxID=3379133 RepID=UPI003EE21B97
MEVYIILSDTGTLFTKMIKRFTKHPLNHASISFSKELVDETYSFGRKRANNPFIGGFIRENMNGELFQSATCAIYSCSVSEREYKQMRKLVQQFEKQQQDYKYNLIGLFGVLLNKKMNRKRAFFCSEFVATVLNRGGIDIKGKHPSLVKPNDLGDCENFRLLYKGQLISYLLQYSNQPTQEIANDTKKQRKILIYSRVC